MRGKLEPRTLSCLPIIRGWLPASAARAAIDDIGKLARRQGLANVSNQNRAEPIVSDIMATTADGVGAQGLTIVGKLQAQTFVAMILLKTGYGIKDAFVIRCRSKREAASIVSYARLSKQRPNRSNDCRAAAGGGSGGWDRKRPSTGARLH
ncbi:hypothetical protein [Sinorhizobium medicae]|uniref:hypothetical protein n=1 Tax=Sinorhizobium medicae TaxID=110321 RepID=UPI0030905E77|nr:hypothetical protein U8C38_28945 [Sinorhizobium medicae]